MPDKTRLAIGCRKTNIPTNPCRPGIIRSDVGDMAHQALAVPEVIERELERRFAGSERNRRRRRTGHVKKSERVLRHCCVAPGPKKTPSMDRRLDTVRPEDTALFPVEVIPESLTLGKDSGTGKPPEPLRDHGPVYHYPVAASGLGNEAEPPATEAVGLHLVTVRVHRKPGLDPHQLRQVKGNHPRIVRVKGDLVIGPQFNQRNGPAVFPVNHFNTAGIGSGDA